MVGFGSHPVEGLNQFVSQTRFIFVWSLLQHFLFYLAPKTGIINGVVNIIESVGRTINRTEDAPNVSFCLLDSKFLLYMKRNHFYSTFLHNFYIRELALQLLITQDPTPTKKYRLFIDFRILLFYHIYFIAIESFYHL